ncbi:MAG: phosphoribosyltransferase family protein [Acetobacteraceae bacterium]|jgi:hypoxanthine phosphoribosyltransferase
MSVTTIGDAAVSPRQPPVPRGLIHTLDTTSFNAACAALMHQVLESFRPHLLVGIRTGGLVVAEAMARAAADPVAVMPLTCRRAATGVKARFKLLPTILAALPRPAVDGLRWLEHRLLTARRRTQAKVQHIDRTEAEAIGQRLAQASGAQRVLVVDDAVDSGVTLATVLRLLRESSPPDTQFRSAVVTVTLAQPLAEPDFVLYRGVLCRFPWSFDAAG